MFQRSERKLQSESAGRVKEVTELSCRGIGNAVPDNDTAWPVCSLTTGYHTQGKI
jgi:hypothetical protein